jgi:hypothetical protein
MTAVSAQPVQARKSILLPAIFAGILCLLALICVLILPASLSQERKDYFTVTDNAISSFSINTFVAEYHQSSRGVDPSGAMAAKGFSSVNTVGWSIQSHRVAAVLALPAIPLILRVVRRDRAR